MAVHFLSAVVRPVTSVNVGDDVGSTLWSFVRLGVKDMIAIADSRNSE